MDMGQSAWLITFGFFIGLVVLSFFIGQMSGKQVVKRIGRVHEEYIHQYLIQAIMAALIVGAVIGFICAWIVKSMLG
jgi:Na+-driven multidrug efflux pump